MAVKLFTADEEMNLAVRSMEPMSASYHSAIAVRDSIAPETLQLFAGQISELIGLLGVRLRQEYAQGGVYPLQASVIFKAIDAHKLVTHMGMLNEFASGFRIAYGLVPKAEEELQVKFRFSGSVAPAVPRIGHATTLTIFVDYGPPVDEAWMFGIATL